MTFHFFTFLFLKNLRKKRLSLRIESKSDRESASMAVAVVKRRLVSENSVPPSFDVHGAKQSRLLPELPVLVPTTIWALHRDEIAHVGFNQRTKVNRI